MLYIDNQEDEIYHRYLFLSDYHYHPKNLKDKKRLICYHLKESEKWERILPGLTE
ncbi:MAG: hypothetical protein ACTS8H_01460 [Arsenophonus sp. NC-PE1-MAG3]